MAREAEADLDKQAHELAEKALHKLPEPVRALKLPKVKEGILKRLRDQSAAELPPQAAVPTPSTANTCSIAVKEAPPPPPPPSLQRQLKQPQQQHHQQQHPQNMLFDGVEVCGDEPWYADSGLRASLRAATAAAHAEQKILVGSPAAEIGRICPEDGSVLGAGAILRLGGAHLGGYGESDIAYAYRQLSRALHPDKNLDVPAAPSAFRRLSDAAQELRQGLIDSRSALQMICAALGSVPTADILERPQEPLFAEATRLLSTVLAAAGEGEVPDTANKRAGTVFASEPATFASGCAPSAILMRWYDTSQLLSIFGSPVLRTAYDCSRKRFRAQFLCLLNRATVAEARRQEGCVRSEWQAVFGQFAELAIWRDLLERLKERIWTLDGKTPCTWPERPKQKSKAQPARAINEGDKSDPICWNFVTTSYCSKGDRCRYLHRFPPGYNVDRASAVLEGRKVGPGSSTIRDIEAALEARRPDPSTSRWASWWREMIRSMLPLGTDAASRIQDADVRKLAVSLWRDVAAWISKSDAKDHLRLFSAEPVGQPDGPMDAVSSIFGDPEWAFVPATDMLLTVGEGIVGVTAEGFMADGPQGFRCETFLEVIVRIGNMDDPPPTTQASDHSGAKRRSRWHSRSRSR